MQLALGIFVLFVGLAESITKGGPWQPGTGAIKEPKLSKRERQRTGTDLADRAAVPTEVPQREAAGKPSARSLQESRWRPKSGEVVECRSLTAWVPAKYVEMHDGMPVCELNGVRRPFQRVRKLQTNPQKLLDAQAAKHYDKHAVPEPHGHTSHVNPLRPNSDRMWYTESREYKYQDGEITDEPAFRERQSPPVQPAVTTSAYVWSWGVSVFLSILFILAMGGGYWCCYVKRESS